MKNPWHRALNKAKTTKNILRLNLKEIFHSQLKLCFSVENITCEEDGEVYVTENSETNAGTTLVKVNFNLWAN